MTRLDLAAIWTVLDSDPPDSGMIVAGTGYEVRAGDILAGVDADGRRSLLVPLLPGEAARTDTSGRSVRLIRISHRGEQYLGVTCINSSLIAIFTQFCSELLAAAEHADSPARAAAETFGRWKELFLETANRASIGERKIVGLLGEMLTLEALLEHGAAKNIDYWRGPFGDAQDFRTSEYALEVKATLIREGRVVSISSIDQLQMPPGAATLWLVHHRLERDPKGFNLADITKRVLSLEASRDRVSTALAENGVDLRDLGLYEALRYRCAETRTYDVSGVAFPRITRESFPSGDVPAGTLNFSYSIDLTNEPPYHLSSSESEEILMMVAREGSNAMDS